MTPELHHPLIHEFPEHRATIHELKTTDMHFRHLFDDYHEIDKAIVRIEEEIDPASDVRTEELKLKRLRLKDDLYAILKKASPSS